MQASIQAHVPSSIHHTTTLQSNEQMKVALPARRGHTESHFVVRATLGGDHVDALIDTGATLSLISPAVAKASGGELKACKEVIKVTLANGDITKIDQYMITKVNIVDKSLSCKLYVMPLPPGYDVLLGTDWLQRHNA